MRQLKFSLWAAGNLLLAGIILLLGWGSTIAIAVLFDKVPPLALVLLIVLPVFTVLWPGWALGQAAMSIALARLAGRRRGKLAHLVHEYRTTTIELTTSDESVVRWEDIAVAVRSPGWRGVIAAYLLSVAGGLALVGLVVFGWPAWASALFLLGWAAGWAWYVVEVRAMVTGRR